MASQLASHVTQPGEGDLHPGRGSSSKGGGGLHLGGMPEGGSASGGGGGVGQTPRDTWDSMRYGQQAGGTHPAGMHSCLDLNFGF